METVLLLHPFAQKINTYRERFPIILNSTTLGSCLPLFMFNINIVILGSNMRRQYNKCSSTIQILKQILFDYLQIPIVLVNVLSPDLAQGLEISQKQRVCLLPHISSAFETKHVYH